MVIREAWQKPLEEWNEEVVEMLQYFMHDTSHWELGEYLEQCGWGYHEEQPFEWDDEAEEFSNVDELHSTVEDCMRETFKIDTPNKTDMESYISLEYNFLIYLNERKPKNS